MDQGTMATTKHPFANIPWLPKQYNTFMVKEFQILHVKNVKN